MSIVGAKVGREMDTRDVTVAVFAPLVAVHRGLLRLLNVERLARLIVLQRRRHQIHAVLSSPTCSRISTSTLPDTLPQPSRPQLNPQQARKLRKHEALISAPRTGAIRRNPRISGSSNRPYHPQTHRLLGLFPRLRRFSCPAAGGWVAYPSTLTPRHLVRTPLGAKRRSRLPQ